MRNVSPSTLRPYQIKLLNDTRKAYAQGYKHPCIVAPCGAGKTFIVAEMARLATAKHNRVLFLVHRQELCEQIAQTFQLHGVDMSLCDVMMVQTATRRIKKLQPPQLIITDENHHCLANSYRRIYDAFPDVLTVGVTATPCRLGGGGLGDVNDILITGVSAKWLIENKFLAPYEYYAPTLADMCGVSIKRGEYDAAQVAERLNKPAIYGDTVNHYRQLADGKKAICYCASIELSKRMADEFTQNGIAARHIDGETPKAERQAAIEKFRSGEIKIICNVDLISEGFDVPDCDVSILLRPTKSLTLYIQQSMRCMRYMQGKTAIIIDHVANYMRHGLPDDDREWTLEPKRKQQSNEPQLNIRQCTQCYFVYAATQRDCPNCGHSPPMAERTVEEIKAAQLEKITQIVVDYTTPADCTTMAELLAYAKRKNYKPGWAYYQAKLRGIL